MNLFPLSLTVTRKAILRLLVSKTPLFCVPYHPNHARMVELADTTDFRPRPTSLWLENPSPQGFLLLESRNSLHGTQMDLDQAINELETKPAAYVLKAAQSDYLYKGSCRNLVKRMKDHRAGRVRHTKNKRPLALVYFEYLDDYTAARKRESFFKTGAGRDFIKLMVTNTANFIRHKK